MLKLKHLTTVSLMIFVLMISACSHYGAHKSAVGGKGAKETKIVPDGPPEMDRDVSHIPNATPKIEPLSRYGNPVKYEVFGVHYHTMPHSNGYSAVGTASWYGRKFHGQRTSSGEPYDMFGMTAAHRSLPLPTYAKIKNLHNGREVIVKINDRGPFVKDRLIDLSYAAAKKLGIHSTGTGTVQITAIDAKAWHKQEQIKLAQKSKPAAKQKGQPTVTKIAQATTKQKGQAPQSTSKKATQVAQAPDKKVSQKNSKTAQTLAKSTQLAKPNKQLYLQLGVFSKESNAQQLAKKATILTDALDHVDVKVFSGKSANKNAYKVLIGPLKDEQEAQNLKKRLIALNGKNQANLVYD